ncbi:hypothetical protein [Joostella sp. CR20]|uniref:hypothetical protein n=1 Tax=Joostella sp. CR20 TaxID=2804312 RepID=UPI00313DDBB5
MKKTSLKKLALVFSLVTIGAYTIVNACSDWDWGFEYSSNYAPEAFNVDTSYTPLFLSHSSFYEIGFETSYGSRFNEDIVKDWSSFLGAIISEKDVQYFLLKDESNEDVNELYQYYSTGNQNSAVKKWKQKTTIDNARFKSFIEFLYLAKQVEVVSVPEDAWYYEPVTYKPLQNKTVLSEIEKKYNTEQNPFLKNRYWFQTIKAHFYNSLSVSPSEDVFCYAVDFFNTTKGLVPQNLLYYRALAYVAGIHYKKKDYNVANYLYSRVFDECPPMRTVAAYNFHPQEQTDWEQALQLATTNEEKAALWAIQGFYKDEISAISHIYSLDPSNKHLAYLLTRLVNKQERKIKDFSNSVSFDVNKKEQYSLVDKRALELVSKIAHSNSNENSFLWLSSLGYLQTLNGAYSSAEKSFEIAESSSPNTKLAKNQLQLLRFINELNKISVLDATTETQILPYLHWLYEEVPNTEESESKFRYYNTLDWSKKYISALYKKQGNDFMAELFMPDLDTHDDYFYDDKSRLDAMERFMLNQEHSEMETLALKLYSKDISDVYYHKAVLATFANNIPEAIVQFKKSEKEVMLLANPFNGFIQDNHDFEHAKNKPYSVEKFLIVANDMQKKINEGGDVFTNSMLLGNAFYNITHFGNARVFYEASTMVGGYSSPDYFRNASMRLITDCSLAESYYKQAFKHATTNEEKAKSAYMLAKCERNAYYNTKYYYQDINPGYWRNRDDETDFLAWSGFQLLKNDYADTKYFEEVINECGYFKTYIEKN